MKANSKLLAIFKTTKISSVQRKLDTDAARRFKSVPTFDFHFEFIISFLQLYIYLEVDSEFCFPYLTSSYSRRLVVRSDY